MQQRSFAAGTAASTVDFRSWHSCLYSGLLQPVRLPLQKKLKGKTCVFRGRETVVSY
jgi:hypothetical protein